MVVIRLTRAGAKNRPFFRMVAADSRKQRDGRFLEILGHYNPVTQPFELVIHKDRVEQWLARGAQPSEQAASLLKRVGIALHRPTAPKPAAAEVTVAKPKKRRVPKASAKTAAKKAAKTAKPARTAKP
jgi:small subunit ribosomal protein S16